jgi:hypothetical protein
MKTTISVISLMTVLLFTSCSTRLVDFTCISSKNMSLRIDKTQGKQVQGSSIMIFGIGVTIKDAIDKALESAGPEYDMLVDGVVRQQNYFIVGGFKVTGTAINSGKLKAMLGEKGFEDFCKENKVLDPNTAQVQN